MLTKLLRLIKTSLTKLNQHSSKPMLISKTNKRLFKS